MNKDLTEKMNNGKIKVIREFGEVSKFCVCYGESFYGKGLTEGYMEFDCFNEAYTYFNGIN